MRAQIRQSSSSLPSGWRDDAPHVICTLPHDSLYDAQYSGPLFCHCPKGLTNSAYHCHFVKGAWCISFCHQIFDFTVLPQVGRVGLLFLLCHYRSKLSETESFFELQRVSPQKMGSCGTVITLGTKLVSFFCFVPAKFNDSLT